MKNIKQKVFVDSGDEMTEKIIILKSEEDVEALAAELNGSLPYVVEFETITGEIIASNQILY